MRVTIEDEGTCELARELAELTGESLTAAITDALRDRIERETDIQERLEIVHAIQDRVQRILRDAPPIPDHAHLLYDENGLPK